MTVRRVITAFFRICLRVFFRRIELVGLERIPEHGAVIFAPGQGAAVQIDLRPRDDGLRLFRVLVRLPPALRRFSKGEGAMIATIKFLAALAFYPLTYLVIAVAVGWTPNRATPSCRTFACMVAPRDHALDGRAAEASAPARSRS